MDSQELIKALQRYSPDQLSKLNHSTLYSARRGAPREVQNLLAPYEHRAFAREATQENPLLALPIAAGALAYQPYKMITGKSRSDPSLDQVGQGLLGVGEGLWGKFQQEMQSIQDHKAGTGTKKQAIDLLESLRSY